MVSGTAEPGADEGHPKTVKVNLFKHYENSQPKQILPHCIAPLHPPIASPAHLNTTPPSSPRTSFFDQPTNSHIIIIDSITSGTAETGSAEGHSKTIRANQQQQDDDQFEIEEGDPLENCTAQSRIIEHNIDGRGCASSGVKYKGRMLSGTNIKQRRGDLTWVMCVTQVEKWNVVQEIDKQLVTSSSKFVYN